MPGRKPTRAQADERTERAADLVLQNAGARDYKLQTILMGEFSVSRATAARYLQRARAALADARPKRIRDLADAAIDGQIDLIKLCRAKGDRRTECRARDSLLKVVMATDLTPATDQPEPAAIDFQIIDSQEQGGTSASVDPA